MAKKTTSYKRTPEEQEIAAFVDELRRRCYQAKIPMFVACVFGPETAPEYLVDSVAPALTGKHLPEGNIIQEATRANMGYRTFAPQDQLPQPTDFGIPDGREGNPMMDLHDDDEEVFGPPVNI